MVVPVIIWNKLLVYQQLELEIWYFNGKLLGPVIVPSYQYFSNKIIDITGKKAVLLVFSFGTVDPNFCVEVIIVRLSEITFIQSFQHYIKMWAVRSLC
jgi:uncharacterized Tic20 family protein